MIVAIIALSIVCIIETLALTFLINPHNRTTPQPATSISGTTEEAEAEALKKRLEAENRAFEELMNYNADIAYGVNRKEE